MKFQLRRSAAFNSTLELFSRPRESRDRASFLSADCRRFVSVLGPARVKKREDAEEDGRRRRRSNKKENSWLVGELSGGVNREIKTELDVFQAVYRESARGKSPTRTCHGVNYTYTE